MDIRFLRVVMILIVMTVAYNVLSTPGDRIDIDVQQLKTMLLYLMLCSGLYAVWDTVRPRRRPPGL